VYATRLCFRVFGVFIEHTSPQGNLHQVRNATPKVGLFVLARNAKTARRGAELVQAGDDRGTRTAFWMFNKADRQVNSS
jgi:hypothetical protein